MQVTLGQNQDVCFRRWSLGSRNEEVRNGRKLERPAATYAALLPPVLESALTGLGSEIFMRVPQTEQ